MPITARNGGQWKTALPYARINGQWKRAIVYVKRNGQWVSTGRLITQPDGGNGKRSNPYLFRVSIGDYVDWHLGSNVRQYDGDLPQGLRLANDHIIGTVEGGTGEYYSSYTVGGGALRTFVLFTM